MAISACEISPLARPGNLIETTLKQRVVAAIKKRHPDYSDWMVTVTYKAE